MTTDTPPGAFPENPFWDFSLALYGRPGIAEACLRLQDESGFDVNLLLFACWLGASGQGRLQAESWHRLIDGTQAWRQEVVEPLRAVRRSLKEREATPQVTVLRHRVRSLERDAEHVEQLAIAELAGPLEKGRAGAAEVLAGLEGYAAAAGAPLNDETRRDFSLLSDEAAKTVEM